MNVIETNLQGVFIIEPKVFGDTRGFFFESYQLERYKQNGMAENFVQDNSSRSCKNVLRGLHHQVDHTQSKLIYVTRGQVFDVVVDIRVGSPTFGKWTGVVLDDQNHRQLYIPANYAHGFCVLSDEADFNYKCTDYYHPESELTVLWNDPDIGIEWPIDQPLLSAKDLNGIRLKDIPVDQLPQYKEIG